MKDHLPYLFSILVLGVLPSVILWVWNWRFYRKYSKLFVLVTVLSIVWGFYFDIVGTRWGVWFYTHNLGIYFFGLPLEEYILLLLLPQQLVAMLLLVRKLYE